MLFFRFLRNSTLVAIVLSANTAIAQTKVITGKVTDSRDGSVLTGVTVSAKESKAAVQTKSDGTYSITVSDAVKTLSFSSVGFASQEVAINGRSSVDVALVVSNTTLNEVVVIGYGTQRRKGNALSVRIDRLRTLRNP